MKRTYKKRPLPQSLLAVGVAGLVVVGVAGIEGLEGMVGCAGVDEEEP